MRLRCRLIRALALGVLACVSCLAAAAAESSAESSTASSGVPSAPSPASMALCASHDLRLADQAIEACSALIAASRDDSAAAATAYGYRGIALMRRASNAQDGEAIRDLEEAVSAGLDTAIAYVFRAQLHLAKQNPDLAIADGDEAIRRDPQLALAYAVRGAAFAAKLDFERSAAAYGEAIRIDPTYTIAFLARARAYIARADWSHATADLDRALQLDSTSPLAAVAFAARSSARHAMADFAGAMADSDAALKLNGSASDTLELRKSAVRTLVSRARASIARADWSRAVSELDQALKLDSTSRLAADAFATRATARYQMSDFAGAIADCEEALRLNPRDAQALRIRMYARSGRGTAPGDGRVGSPDAFMVYVARGPAGACGEKCEEWIAVEGAVDLQGPAHLVAVLDRLGAGARKLPVVLDLRGASNVQSAISIGRILRERGFEATVGQTQVDECDDPVQPGCIALKRAGKPVQATLVPNHACGVVCLLGLAGGVRRTVPDATTVVIGSAPVGDRLAAGPLREEQHLRARDLVKQHLAQMGLDPQVADMIEEHYDSSRGTGLAREDIARLRIVTAR